MTEDKKPKRRKIIKCIAGIFVLFVIIPLMVYLIKGFYMFSVSRVSPDTQLKQKNCVWVSDDGKITIENDGTNHFTGTMKTDEGEVQIFPFFKGRYVLYIYDEERQEIFCGLLCSFRHNIFNNAKTFTATVSRESDDGTYEKGQKIVFHRVDK